MTKKRITIFIVVVVGILTIGAVIVFASHGDGVVDMTYAGAMEMHNDAVIIQGGVGAGTGNWDPFLTVSANTPTEAGLNSIKSLKQFDSFYGGTRTHPLLASAVPSILFDSDEDGTPELWREFGLDANDQGKDTWMSIDEMKIFLTEGTGAVQYDVDSESFTDANGISVSFTKIYDLDNTPILMVSQGLESGSGVSDISMLLPDELFPCEYGALECDEWVVLYTEYGAAEFTEGEQPIGKEDENDAADFDWDVSAGFEEWRTELLPVVNVSKTAVESFTREYTWDITKDVTPQSLDLLAGQSGDFDYAVFLDQTITDYGFNVSGEVTITNPTGGDVIAKDIPADITAIEDVLAGYGAVTLTCPETPPFTLGAGEIIICTYSITEDTVFSETFVGDNVASVTIDIEGETRTYSDTETVDFNGVEPTVIGYDTVNVTDTNGGLGSAGVDNTWYYVLTQTCSSDPADYTDGFYSFTHDNTATIDETGQSDSETVTVNCYAPTVTKDAAGNYDERHDWDITKEYDGEYDLLAGGSATHGYEVSVTLTEVEEKFSVTGKVYVTNPTGSPGDMEVGLTDYLNDAAATAGVISGCTNGTWDGTAMTVTVAPGATAECSYEANPGNRTADRNTVEITFGDFVDSAFYDFSWTKTDTGYPTIDVTDTNGESWSTSESETWTYSRDFTCSSDPNAYTDGFYTYDHDNTATITQTGQNDDATVTVNCYAPVVTKNVETYFTRTFEWDISKTATQDYFEVIQGESVDIPYEVTVWVTGHTDDGWGVKGQIFVYNPHPTETMTLTDVSDVAGGISASVSCPTFDIGPESTLTCTYDTGAQNGYPDANPFGAKNVATAVFAGSNWTGDADIVFGDPTELVDEMIDVEDDQYGFLGSVSYDEAPKTFNYTRTVQPEELECGENIIDNTATFTTNDTGTTDSADASVTIYVICGETRLAPTNTECVDFRDFPDAPENNLEFLYYQWDAGSGEITNVTPGAMFYWIEVVHSGGALTVAADQDTVFSKEVTATDVKFYDASCTRILNVSFTLNKGDADLTATLAEGIYYMQVRYAPKSLIGEPADGTSSYDFDFSATVNGAATIPDSLTLKPK